MIKRTGLKISDSFQEFAGCATGTVLGAIFYSSIVQMLARNGRHYIKPDKKPVTKITSAIPPQPK